MLTSMRKNSKFLNIFLWLVIVAFLATIFVVWGLGEKQTDASFAAKIDDYVVSYAEYRNEYDKLTAQMRSLFGDQADTLIREDESFGKLVIENIVNQRLLLLEAERIGVPVSDAEVADSITSTPTFYTGGKFDIELYELVLYNNRLTPAAYEAQIRKEITISKMKQLIDSSVAVTEQEIENEFKYQNAQLEASYFTVHASNYAVNEATDDELIAYFTENAEKYRQSAKIRLKYTVFDPATSEFTSELSDEDLLRRYEAAIGSFTEPESLELNQIVVFIENPNDESSVISAETKIKEAQAQLNAGTSFAEVAASYSDFPGESGNGFLGRVTRPEGTLDAIDAVLFAMENGAVTDIIREGAAFYIFKVDNREASKVIPFETVKEDLRNSMLDQEKASVFRNRMYAIYRDVLNSGNLTAYLEQNPDAFTTEETGLLAENDTTAFFQADPELKTTLFALAQTDLSPLMDVNGKTYLYEVIERSSSYIPELADVKEQVLADYERSRAFTAAVNDVDAKLTAETMTATEFSDAAAAFGAYVDHIPAYSRMTSQLTLPSALTDLLFRQAPGNVLSYPLRDGALIYIARVDKVIDPDMTTMEATRDALEGYLLSTKRQDALVGVLNKLKSEHNVIINESFLVGQ